jgi:hypothetical protein
MPAGKKYGAFAVLQVPYRETATPIRGIPAALPISSSCATRITT